MCTMTMCSMGSPRKNFQHRLDTACRHFGAFEKRRNIVAGVRIDLSLASTSSRDHTRPCYVTPSHDQEDMKIENREMTFVGTFVNHIIPIRSRRLGPTYLDELDKTAFIINSRNAVWKSNIRALPYLDLTSSAINALNCKKCLQQTHRTTAIRMIPDVLQ